MSETMLSRYSMAERTILGVVALGVLALGAKIAVDAVALATLPNYNRMRLAEQSLPDDATADDFKSALLQDPLARAALSGLAKIEGKADQTDAARAAMQRVMELSRRDVDALLWLTDDALKRGDYVTANETLDRLLRTQPNMWADSTATALRAVADVPEARKSLIQVLATNPSWRYWWIKDFGANGDPAKLRQLLYDLRDAGSPPTQDELGFYLGRVMRMGDYAQAHLDWTGLFVPPDQIEGLSYVYNGDFNLPISGTPFDWRIAPRSGAKILVRDIQDGQPAAKALTVITFGDRVPFANVWQSLAIPPGLYTLKFSASATNLKTRGGFVWRVFCSAPEWRLIAETDRISSSMGWTNSELIFEVPQGCTGEQIRLDLAARTPAEETVSGEVSFTNLSIVPAKLD